MHMTLTTKAFIIVQLGNSKPPPTPQGPQRRAGKKGQNQICLSVYTCTRIGKIHILYTCMYDTCVGYRSFLVKHVKSGECLLGPLASCLIQYYPVSLFYD